MLLDWYLGDATCVQDYRSEVGEILAGDPQLVQEIQFDLKRFDEEQRRTIQTPPISVTPHTMMVSDCVLVQDPQSNANLLIISGVTSPFPWCAGSCCYDNSDGHTPKTEDSSWRPTEDSSESSWKEYV